MKDAQKPDHKSLSTIVSRLKEGRFVIPDFQREFEWQPWDVRDLMRSIFLDYYVGSLLLWKGRKANFEALSCEPVFGMEPTNSAEHIVLDGQQRLTAIFYAFVAPDKPLPRRANRYVYFIHVDKFSAGEHDQAFEYAWNKNYVNKILNDREFQFEKHIFPLSIVGGGDWDLAEWVQDYAKFWKEKLEAAQEANDENAEKEASQYFDEAKAFGLHVKGIIDQYQLSYIELDEELEIDKVCDIFTKINSKGVQLDVFDLLNALLKPKNLQLKHMWRAAKPRLQFVESPKLNVYILQVMSILRQAYCSPKYLYYLLPGQVRQIRDASGKRSEEVMVPDVADFEKRWEESVSALETAISLLKHPQEFGAISSSYLPYISILPAFSALQFHLKSLPANQQLEAQRKIRHWYWASVFTNRYSGSVESTSARDFLDVKDWIADPSSEPELIEEFKNRFKDLNLQGETKKGSSVYNGIFNLFVLQGASDWMTGNKPQHGDLDDHHIIPASWGTENLEGNAVNTILNRSPLTAQTNRHVINDQLPNQYIPQLIENSSEGAVRAIMESHFISPAALQVLLRDPFTKADFDEFISERQKTLMEAIENLLIKERFDLSLPLRELDDKIERIELALRNSIDTTLEGNTEKIPSHIALKVNERIQKAIKKNVAKDADKYKTLEGQLEYFDLRELQNTISGKSLWPEFSEVFGNKETLIGKFDQLAELRNSIRHSRSVDEVTKKEGEAAIIWFEQVLQDCLVTS